MTQTSQPEKTVLVHYGKLLQMNMIDQGRSKEYVKTLLGYASYDTLNARLKDAKFSFDELRTLTEKGLL
jgi:hypothetical protein